MSLLADYEGLGIAIAQGLWLLLTIPAALVALGGIVAVAWRRPRRTLAIWLGTVACVVEGAAIAMVCLAFAEEQALHAAYAERFRPGPLFWGLSATTVAGGLLAVYLGIRRKPSQSA